MCAQRSHSVDRLDIIKRWNMTMVPNGHTMFPSSRLGTTFGHGTVPRSPAGSRSLRRPLTTASAGQTASQDPKPLVVVGSVNADLVLQVDRLPKEGETLGAHTLYTFPGGKGANQAAAAARLQHPTYFIGQVGTDANAALLRDALGEAGVRLDHLCTVDGPCGTAVILVQPSGENSIIIVGGANTASWDFDEAAVQLMRGAGALLLQREVPEAVNARAARIAAAAGVPVILDCGGMEGPILNELLRDVAVLSPNETELARLSGRGTDTLGEAQAAAGAILQRGVQAVLVKRGTSGSLLVTQDGQCIVQPIFEATKVVDTTGAGDCFTAAYAVAMLAGKGAEDCLQFAAAASALCVQKAGAMPSLPHRDEVVRLIKEQGT